METFELRYFVSVARLENIHRASEEIGVSPGSLSKAIARLEDELKTKLFEREGRNISLTSQGQLLLERASQILALEESARLEIGGKNGVLNVVIAGPEVILSKFGSQFSQAIAAKYPHSTFDFLSTHESEVLRRVLGREAHFGITTEDIPDGFETRAIEECLFVTVAGKRHPLAKQTPSKTHDIGDVLKHSFISPNLPFLGKVGAKQSLDGWRDDKFKRQIKFRSSSLKLIEEMVSNGEALAYLPDYIAEPFIQNREWQALKVSGCPYSCKQKIKIVTRSPIEAGWIKQVF
jgi:DNA-binding transcriptional LysR family regulator